MLNNSRISPYTMFIQRLIPSDTAENIATTANNTHKYEGNISISTQSSFISLNGSINGCWLIFSNCAKHVNNYFNFEWRSNTRYSNRIKHRFGDCLLLIVIIIDRLINSWQIQMANVKATKSRSENEGCQSYQIKKWKLKLWGANLFFIFFAKW